MRTRLLVNHWQTHDGQQVSYHTPSCAMRHNAIPLVAHFAQPHAHAVTHTLPLPHVRITPISLPGFISPFVCLDPLPHRPHTVRAVPIPLTLTRLLGNSHAHQARLHRLTSSWVMSRRWIL